MHGRYDAGFTAKLQLKDIRLYLENARAAGITDDVAGPVVDLWQRMEAAMPGADITDMYRYTQKRRRSEALPALSLALLVTSSSAGRRSAWAGYRHNLLMR